MGAAFRAQVGRIPIVLAEAIPRQGFRSLSCTESCRKAFGQAARSPVLDDGPDDLRGLGPSRVIVVSSAGKIRAGEIES